MAGLRCIRTRIGARLEIPTKQGTIAKFYTSLKYLDYFVDGKISVIYFNPITDIKKREDE